MFWIDARRAGTYVKQHACHKLSVHHFKFNRHFHGIIIVFGNAERFRCVIRKRYPDLLKLVRTSKLRLK